MTVITMTREMGSRGKDVACGLAEALGLKVVHKEVVEHHLAKRLQVHESFVHRYLEGGVRVLDNWRIDKKALALYTAEEIFELAERGNVLIRGWGATQLLRSVPHVVCVRVCAPLDARVRTLMARLNLDDAKTALKEIKENDAAHSRAIRSLSQGSWKNPVLYDLVLNTERVPVEKCVDLVLGLVENPEFKETPQSRATLAALKRAAQQHQLRQEGGVLPELGPSSIHRRSLRARASQQVPEDGPTSREERDLFRY